MLDYTFKEIEAAVRGRLAVEGRRKKFKGRVSTDSRTVEKGDMFIALKGPKYDGHDFIDDAIKKGARLFIVDIKMARRVKRNDPDMIYVDDTLQALGRLGAFHRRKKNIPVIAITGSCGKTTTKDLIAHLLQAKYKVHKSLGTENNAIGVPKTLLGIDDHDVAVVEIGANQIGEIRHLSRMSQPTHVVLTMIGNAHLMGFRNIQGVRREKLSIIDGLTKSGTIIYNADDKNFQDPRIKKYHPIRVGLSNKYDVHASNIDLLEDGCEFTLNSKQVLKTSLMGRHNIINILLACAVAKKFKISPKVMANQIKSLKAGKGRVRYQEHNYIHWIDDSYNANPSSLLAAIELFRTYKPQSRKILVIGDMLELGIRAVAFHREAGRTIAGYPFDLVLTVGELSERFAHEAKFHGFDKDKIREFKNSDQAGKFLKKKLQKGDTVLLKGSRRIRMERVMYHCGLNIDED